MLLLMRLEDNLSKAQEAGNGNLWTYSENSKVDLSSRSTAEIPTLDYADRFLGGDQPPAMLPPVKLGLPVPTWVKDAPITQS